MGVGHVGQEMTPITCYQDTRVSGKMIKRGRSRAASRQIDLPPIGLVFL